MCSREGGRRLTRPNRCGLSEARHRGAGGAVTRGPPAPANSASGSRVDAAARAASAKTQAGGRAGSRVPRPTCPRPGVYTVRPGPSPPRREPRVHGEDRGLPAAILLTKPPRVTLKLSSSPPDHCLLKRVGAKKHVPFGPGQGWELSSSPQNPRSLELNAEVGRIRNCRPCSSGGQQQVAAFPWPLRRQPRQGAGRQGEASLPSLYGRVCV